MKFKIPYLAPVLSVLASVSVILFVENGSWCSAQTERLYEDYQAEGLKEHNRFRQKHGSEEMVIDKELEALALTCAEEYAQKQAVDSECGKSLGKGENTLMIVDTPPTPGPIPIAWMMMAGGVGMWYAKNVGYNYDDPGNSTDEIKSFLPFTQVVWKSTTSLGCGVKTVDKTTVACCLYAEPGNKVITRKEQGSLDFKLFTENVRPPKS